MSESLNTSGESGSKVELQDVQGGWRWGLLLYNIINGKNFTKQINVNGVDEKKLYLQKSALWRDDEY